MGQYYKAINVDKMEAVSPWDCKTVYTNADGKKMRLGQGAKLMEHSYIDNPYVGSIENLLTPDGEWYKARLVWGGDYADQEEGETDENNNLYTLVNEIIKPKKKTLDKKWKFVCNHDLKVCYERPKFEKDKWIINPLPLLTCEGNGRGGGDFRGEDDRLGLWARDQISIEAELPKEFELLSSEDIKFSEE
jgi:hypothetical protein